MPKTGIIRLLNSLNALKLAVNLISNMARAPSSTSLPEEGDGGSIQAIYNSIVATATTDPRDLYNNIVTSETGKKVSNFVSTLLGANDDQGVLEEYPGKEGRDAIATRYKKILRLDDLILHALQDKVEPTVKFPPYNIILLGPLAPTPTSYGSTVKLPETMYSLYRTDCEEEATRTFHIYLKVFPDLLKALSTPINKSVLGKIVKMSSQHETYCAAQVAAALEMTEELRSPVFRGRLLKLEGKSVHTPLQVACIHGKFLAFRMILESEDKSNLLDHLRNHADLEGNSLLHLAAGSKDGRIGGRIVKWIREKVMALYKDKAKGEALLLQMFHKKNVKGLSPIHVSVMSENVETVEELSFISGGWAKSATDSGLLDIKAKHGYTALHIATIHPTILSRLLSLGADPNIGDREGLTPLHKSVIERELKSTLYLLANQADPDIKATSEKHLKSTPLHLASSVCDINSMRALLTFGASQQLEDGNGHTPKQLVEKVFQGDKEWRRGAMALFYTHLEERKPNIRLLYRQMTGQTDM